MWQDKEAEARIGVFTKFVERPDKSPLLENALKILGGGVSPASPAEVRDKFLFVFSRHHPLEQRPSPGTRTLNLIAAAKRIDANGARAMKLLNALAADIDQRNRILHSFRTELLPGHDRDAKQILELLEANQEGSKNGNAFRDFANWMKYILDRERNLSLRLASFVRADPGGPNLEFEAHGSPKAHLFFAMASVFDDFRKGELSAGERGDFYAFAGFVFELMTGEEPEGPGAGFLRQIQEAVEFVRIIRGYPRPRRRRGKAPTALE